MFVCSFSLSIDCSFLRHWEKINDRRGYDARRVDRQVTSYGFKFVPPNY